MAAKLQKDQSVTRELLVEMQDGDEKFPVLASLNADGTVTIRLKGKRRSVTVDVVKLVSESPATEAISADQPMTSKKRTYPEHLFGK